MFKGECFFFQKFIILSQNMYFLLKLSDFLLHLSDQHLLCNLTAVFFNRNHYLFFELFLRLTSFGL